ncbi:MAG: adenylate/guanylate cyclase domain-containing protein [Alphaproteobacteria bacterium]
MSDSVDQGPANGDIDIIDEPFPLRRRFVRQFMPLFFLLLGIVSVAGGLGAAAITESIYLDVAERRAAVIDAAVSKKAPVAWRRLAQSTTPLDALASPAGIELVSHLVAEVEELGLSHLKIYRIDGLTIFSVDPAQIGEVESNALFQEASKGNKGVERKILSDGRVVYELYIPFYSSSAESPLIFELYEPVGHLDSAMFRAGLPSFLALVILLTLLAVGLYRLVALAQRDIDRRTGLLTDFRTRLERFVSRGAKKAARDSINTNVLESRRTECAILFSDIRKFTSFSESRPPADVVAFLDQIVGLQVEIIARHDGDVDKMIGDAVLALFEGEKMEKRALLAAIEIQTAMGQSSFPRKIGIGVYTGSVVIGPVGPRDRMDFTVIGDSVNTASRLCSAADEGEIVVDRETLGRAGEVGGFGTVETLSVKGRMQGIDVARYQVDAKTRNEGA